MAEKWASDGGYYNAPSYEVQYTPEQKAFIKSVAEELKAIIQQPEGTVTVERMLRTLRDLYMVRIIKNVESFIGINFGYDIDEDWEIYWLEPGEDIDQVLYAIDSVWFQLNY